MADRHQEQQEQQERIDAAREEARRAQLTQIVRAFAQGMRTRAAERQRAWREQWAALDTAPLVQLWPHPTPQPVPRRPTGSLGDPEVLLSEHPYAGPAPRFHRHERVYYTVAGRTTLGRVESWRRWSTGYKYTVRASIRRRDPQRGYLLDWAATTMEVWEGYLTSDEERLKPRPRGPRQRRTMPLMPPPSTPSTPGTP